MSTQDKEKLWQAYIDGELSASEMAGFEASLTPGEQELLTADVKFERCFVEKLSMADGCPEAVWKQLKTQMSGSDAGSVTAFPGERSSRSRWIAFATVAAAAAVAFMIYTVAPNGSPGLTPPTVVAASTVDELAGRSDVEPDRLVIQEFMHDHKVDLKLREEQSLPIAKHHSNIKLVGAHAYPNDDYVEIYAGCCKKPVMIVLARRGTEAARLLGQASDENSQVQATRIVGDYVAAVVGEHPAYGLLDIFEGQYPQ